VELIVDLSIALGVIALGYLLGVALVATIEGVSEGKRK